MLQPHTHCFYFTKIKIKVSSLYPSKLHSMPIWNPASSLRVHSNRKSACEANFCSLSMSLLTLSFDIQLRAAKNSLLDQIDFRLRYATLFGFGYWEANGKGKISRSILSGAQFFLRVSFVWFECQMQMPYLLFSHNLARGFAKMLFSCKKLCHNLHSCHSIIHEDIVVQAAFCICWFHFLSLSS